MKTGNESIEMILRRKRILFAGFVRVHGGHETVEVRYVRRTIGGRGLHRGGQKKKWLGCFLDDLRAFGISADQWTTAAQDKGE